MSSRLPDPERPPAGPRRWLGIDGALGPFSAAVVDGAHTTTGQTSAKQALEQGLAVVEQVLGEAGFVLGDIDALAVGLGPGSFTGLRIAISYAKALAVALKIPLMGVSSYDALESSAEMTAPVLAVVTGRTGMGCARLRSVDGSWTKCGTYEDIVDWVAARVDGGTLAVCGAVEGVAARLGERGFIVRAMPPLPSPALAIAQLAAKRFAAGPPPTQSPHDVRPDYGELPAAEVPKSIQR